VKSNMMWRNLDLLELRIDFPFETTL